MVAPFLFTDNARSTIGAPLSLGGTTITLAGGGGALFPNPAPGQQFALTLNDLATQTIFETVWCTARAGDVLTVIRAQEGTAARAWSVGDYCWNGPTAGQMNNMVQTPHMLDATIAPVFAATAVQGTFSAIGPATFSSSGSFGSAVTSTDPNSAASGGIIVANSGANGARIRLQGTPGTTGTPNKIIQAVNGSLVVQNSAGTATIFSLSDLGDVGAIRALSASGTGSFGGAVSSASSGTFTDPANGGVIVNGAGAGSANIHLHNSSGDKYIRTSGNRLEFVNAAYTNVIAALDDTGNFTTVGGLGGALANITGAVTAGGAVSGLAVNSTNGNVTALNGKLRASIGARGSGDPNAGVILADYLNSGSYNIFPNGLIVQWGIGGAVCNLTQSEGGLTWFFGVTNVIFGTAFPTAIGGITVTPFDLAGHLVFNANVQSSPNLNGMTVLPHVTSIQNVFFYWVAVGW